MLSRRVLLVYAIICCLATRVDGTRGKGRTLHLAILLPYSGSWPVGYGISGAVPLAVNYIRTDPSFAYFRQLGYDVDYTIYNCPCDEGPGLVSFAKLVNTANPKIDAFIGPSCDSVCEPAGYMLGSMNKVGISYSCVSGVISQLPYLVRTVAPYNVLGPFIGDFIAHFGWTRVALVTGQELIWQTTAQYLKDYLNTINIQATIYAFYMVSINPNFAVQLQFRNDTITAARKTNMVFMALMYATDLEQFVYLVKAQNMINGDYAFMASSLSLASTFWNDDFIKQNGVVISDVNGWFDLSANYPTGEWTDNFLKNVLAAAIPEPGENGSTPYLSITQIDPSVYPLYDAIVMYATSVIKTIDTDLDYNDGYTMSQLFLNTWFNGSSGVTQIDDVGDAFPNYALNNVRYGVFVESAVYIVNQTYFTNQILLWPGGGLTPVLGRPACGWDGEYCNSEIGIIVPVVVVASLALIAASVALFIRRRRANEYLNSLAWKISYAELDFDLTNSTKSSSSTHSVGRAATISGDITSEGSIIEESAEGGVSVANQWTSSISLAHYNRQLVAVKHIKKPYVSLTPSVVKEINQVRGLRHPNLASFIGACVEPTKVCVVTGYCSKGSLRDVLQNRHVNMDKMFTIAFANDIVQGMSYLHASPIKYHGSLKSTNVLVDSRWACRIADFGLREFRAGEGGPNRGEPAYFYGLLWTAPELLRVSDYARAGSDKGDVYSFGIILQELVTKKSPFARGYQKPKEVVDRVRIAEFPPYRPQVTVEEAGSVELLQLMMSCWDEEPTIRPTFENIKETLKRMSRGRQTNIVDQMIYMMEKYSNQLEEVVSERTRQLADEQKKTEELLSRMLPRSVADALKLGHTVDPENYASATVAFSDIVGFTAMAAMSNPLQVVTLLNDLYTCFDTAIEKFDAYKVETIGDAYMVASGVPVRNGIRHAGEIAMLALELLSEIRTFRIRHLPDKQLQLRLGVHSGPVVAGVVGVKMPRYCLFGDTVNTASRMESSGLALRIHVSPDTAQILNELGGYNLVERGPITMKGKGTIVTYFLVGKDGFNKKLPDVALAAPLSEHEFK